ncbi:MAG: hypothetical protein B5M48_01695 [Candidatus Omnitrophica bacterium 4484_213]|nr:MAG: hypothetical protein B5M48_01695 [Candidatus Omnitrophica bacterium 4484_213]
MARWRENKVVGIVAGVVLLVSAAIIFYQIRSSRPKPRLLSKEEQERLLKEMGISPKEFLQKIPERKREERPKGMLPEDILRKIPEKR